MEPQRPTLIDGRLAAALNHSTRAHALTVLTQRVASPKEVSDELGLDVSLVSYHFDKLVDLDCIELVDTKKRRGATEHFYRATIRHYFDPDAWGAVPEDDRLGIVMGILRTVSGDLTEGLQAGTVHADDNHLSRTFLLLDQAGWDRVVSLLAATLEELLTIRAEATKRMSESREKPIAASVSILHFELPTRKRSE